MKFELSSRPVYGTDIFERCYEKELQLEIEERDALIKAGSAAYIYVDGILAGETYGACPADIRAILDESLPDVNMNSLLDFYTYSTTIIQTFRGLRLAPLLLAYAQGVLTHRYIRIIGHATTPSMVHIRKQLGAQILQKRDNWYDTKRTAWFYVQKIIT